MANFFFSLRSSRTLVFAILALSSLVDAFSPFPSVLHANLLYRSISKIAKNVGKHGGEVPKTLATQGVQLSTPTIQSTETVKKIHCVDGKCHMFRPDPEIRKIMITYLHHKLSKEIDGVQISGQILCTKERLRNIIGRISPPVDPILLDREVESILEQLAGSCVVEERDFITSVLLDNNVWSEVGETVVKELVYLDNLSHDDEFGVSILSDSCVGKLEASLHEDGSSITKFSKADAALACKLFALLNMPHEARLVTNAALPSRIPFLADVEKCEPYDSFGNPSLMMILAERLKKYDSPFNGSTSMDKSSTCE
eukprot:gene31027-37501_t